jgi:hypothetical protein
MNSVKKPTNTKQNPSNTLDDNKITRDEFRQILKSMDRKEFENHMGDYIKEISNPENVSEQNQFLKNAEENKDLPQNVKLAQPKKGFCMKSEKFSVKRPGVRQKVYINICQLEEINPPEEDQNRKGMWSLPHLVNKGRNDQDKKGDLCTTYDIVFNPKAIEMSRQFPSFKKFVCETSISAINLNILKSEQEKISNDYVIKTKFDYKGKEVAIMNVHSLYKSELDSRKEPKENFKTNIQKDIEDKKYKSENNKRDVLEDDEDEKVFDKPDIDVEISEKEVKDLETRRLLEADTEKGAESNLAPKFTIKYSTEFELHKHFYLPSNVEEKNSEKLVIEIQVPKMDNLNVAELELDKKKLHFRYRDIYLLDIELPAEIDKERSDAKFDRKKGVLILSANLIKREIEQPLLKKLNDSVEIVKDEEDEDINLNADLLKRNNQDHETGEKIDSQIKDEKQNGNEVSKINTSETEILNNRGDSNVDSIGHSKDKTMELNEKTNSIQNNSNFNENLKHIDSDEVKIETTQNSNKLDHLINPVEESKSKIIEIPKEKDEDDEVNACNDIDSNQNSIQSRQTKISYINFNCDLIYEID